MTTDFGFGSYSYCDPQYAYPSQKPLCTPNKCTFPYPCESLNDCTGYKIDLQPGNYMFEVYGAQGGSFRQNEGGAGGHSIANVQIPSMTSIYLFVGAQGSFGNSNSKYIYGGGGYSSSGNGGGATDFRLNQTNLKSRFLIAGGGGGTYYNGNDWLPGGHGGGLIGFQNNRIPGSANQVKGNSFGYGYSTNNNYGGGGGGLYGGTSAEGGSGFVYSENRKTTDIDKITAITVKDGYTEVGANYGYGYAIIRCLSRLNRVLRLQQTSGVSTSSMKILQLTSYSVVVSM